MLILHFIVPYLDKNPQDPDDNEKIRISIKEDKRPIENYEQDKVRKL